MAKNSAAGHSSSQYAENESLKSSILRKTTSSNEDSSLYKSEFLDPLVRISQMKFLTSPDIRIANCAKFALLDIR